MIRQLLVARTTIALASALAGAGVVAATATTGAREEITINHGDSVSIRFSIKADSVLKVANGKVTDKTCGTGAIYLRNWRGTEQLSADTVMVHVVNCAPVDTAVAKASICRVPTDSVTKYGIDGSKGLNPHDDSLVHSWGCLNDTMTIDPPPPANTFNPARKA